MTQTTHLIGNFNCKNPFGKRYITKGRKYKVISFDGERFEIKDDQGNTLKTKADNIFKEATHE